MKNKLQKILHVLTKKQKIMSIVIFFLTIIKWSTNHPWFYAQKDLKAIPTNGLHIFLVTSRWSRIPFIHILKVINDTLKCVQKLAPLFSYQNTIQFWCNFLKSIFCVRRLDKKQINIPCWNHVAIVIPTTRTLFVL